MFYTKSNHWALKDCLLKTHCLFVWKSYQTCVLLRSLE